MPNIYYPESFAQPLTPGWNAQGNAAKFQDQYDALAATGGRIHFPRRYFFSDPVHLHSNRVVITGDGPQTGFWFQLTDPSQDAFVVEPDAFTSPTAFLQGVEMSDFSVLGGADCANNLVRIKYVVRSRFRGIHAMGGTRSHPFAIGTGWCNQFELVATYATDHPGIPSPIYLPSTWNQPLARPGSDYLHLLPSDEYRGGLNANHFWLLIEGYGYPPDDQNPNTHHDEPDTYNLVRISNQNGPRKTFNAATNTWVPDGNWTDQGNNWISGTAEANVGGYALYATGTDAMCLHQLHTEGTKGIALVDCRQPTVSQTRWFTDLILDDCLAPSVRHSAGNSLVIEATTSHAEVGHVIVGQGGGNLTNRSSTSVATGPVLHNTTGLIVGSGTPLPVTP